MPSNSSPFDVDHEAGKETVGSLPESVRVVNAFLSVMEPVHRIYSRQWYLNIANYAGNQNIIYDDTRHKFFVPEAPSWRVRLVVNKILPIVRIQIAKLMAMKLEAYTVPATRSESDQKAAQISNKLLKNIQTNEDFDDIYTDLIHWLDICGNVWLFTLYDENAGKTIRDFETDPETGEPTLDENGQKIPFEFKTGDILFDIGEPFEVIPDFSVTNVKKMSGIVRRKPRSVSYIKEKYGVEVEAEKLNHGFMHELRTMASAVLLGNTSKGDKGLNNSAIVNDYYENPTPKHPKGRHFITAGDKELFVGELDTELNGEYVIPVVHYGAIKVPKRLLYMSPVENLLPLQWNYNRARSQIIEDNNTLGRPKLFAVEGSIVDGAVTDEPGEVVEVDGDRYPQYATPSGPNPSALDNINRLADEMQEVGGVHDISHGKLPRRANSGLALNILEEKDNTIIGPMKDSIKTGVSKNFALALNIARKRFGETRVLKIVDKERLPDLTDYTGADLSSSDDVRTMVDDQFPQSRSAKLEYADALVERGIISPQTARKIIDIDSFANLSDILLDQEQERIIASKVAEQQALAQQDAGVAQEGAE